MILLNLLNEVWRLIVFVPFFFFFFLFPALNLSVTFLRDDWTELYKTLGKDRPEYLYVHAGLVFLIWGRPTTFLGDQKVEGSNFEPYGKKS